MVSLLIGISFILIIGISLKRNYNMVLENCCFSTKKMFLNVHEFYFQLFVFTLTMTDTLFAGIGCG